MGSVQNSYPGDRKISNQGRKLLNQGWKIPNQGRKLLNQGSGNQKKLPEAFLERLGAPFDFF